MIISKSPLRVSFFGGGTDIPEFYNKYGGIVISTAIKKYIYVSVKELNEAYKENYRLNYSVTEKKTDIDSIKNNIIRESLKIMSIDSRLYVSTISDVPLRSGLGSSSAFAGGLISALANKNNINLSKNKLAEIACDIEINKLKSPIGKQDQYASVYGGINKITFNSNNIYVKKIFLNKKFKSDFEKSFLLLWSGMQRNANSVMFDQSNKMSSKIDYYLEMKKIANEGYKIFNEPKFNINKFSDLLEESWQVKTKLSSKILNKKTSHILNIAKSAGALSYKVCGAGNGGFILLCAKYNTHEDIKKALSNYIFHKFEISEDGVRNFKV
jgi:D-glycero-alpha-D-manno-heptose-7-phosphate kinase